MYNIYLSVVCSLYSFQRNERIKMSISAIKKIFHCFLRFVFDKCIAVQFNLSRRLKSSCLKSKRERICREDRIRNDESFSLHHILCPISCFDLNWSWDRIREAKRGSDEEGVAVKENAKERSNERQKLARLVGNAWNVRTHSRTAFCRVCARAYLYVRPFARLVLCFEEGQEEGHGGDPNYASASGGEITLNAPW